MEQNLIISESREVIKEISLKLLPDLAKSQTQLRVSSAFVDPVLDTLAIGEISLVAPDGDEAGGFGEAGLIVLILVPAVASALAAILTQLGMSTAINFWQRRTKPIETIFHDEVHGVIKKINPNLTDREVDRLAKKVVQTVWDYLSNREQVVAKLIEEMTGGLTQPELTELREKMDQYFSESELNTLCFDIDVDYEEFATNTKQDKVREILAYCMRRNRVSDLRSACRQARPFVTW